MKQAFMITGLLLLLQLSVQSQEQVKKGKWFIGHTVGGIYYDIQRSKYYNDDFLGSDTRDSEFGFQLELTGPYWGSIGAGRNRYKDLMDDEDDHKKSHDINIYLKPTAGYFIKDNLLVGGTVYIEFETAKSSSVPANYTFLQKNNSLGLGIGPMIRYYFEKGKKGKPFAGLESLASFTKHSSNNFVTSTGTEVHIKSKGNGTQYEIKPFVGYGWFPGRHWSIELRLDYSYHNYRDREVITQHVNDVLQPDYPQSQTYKEASHRIAINAGIGFTL